MVRFANISDACKITECIVLFCLEHGYFNYSYTRILEVAKQELSDPNSYVTVYEKKDKILGVLAVNFTKSIQTHDKIGFDIVWATRPISSKIKRFKIAIGLMSGLVDWLTKHQIKRMNFNLKLAGSAIKKFLTKSGFKLEIQTYSKEIL